MFISSSVPISLQGMEANPDASGSPLGDFNPELSFESELFSVEQGEIGTPVGLMEGEDNPMMVEDGEEMAETASAVGGPLMNMTSPQMDQRIPEQTMAEQSTVDPMLAPQPESDGVSATAQAMTPNADGQDMGFEDVSEDVSEDGPHIFPASPKALGQASAESVPSGNGLAETQSVAGRPVVQPVTRNVENAVQMERAEGVGLEKFHRTTPSPIQNHSNTMEIGETETLDPYNNQIKNMAPEGPMVANNPDGTPMENPAVTDPTQVGRAGRPEQADDPLYAHIKAKQSTSPVPTFEQDPRLETTLKPAQAEKADLLADVGKQSNIDPRIPLNLQNNQAGPQTKITQVPIQSQINDAANRLDAEAHNDPFLKPIEARVGASAANILQGVSKPEKFEQTQKQLMQQFRPIEASEWNNSKTTVPPLRAFMETAIYEQGVNPSGNMQNLQQLQKQYSAANLNRTGNAATGISKGNVPRNSQQLADVFTKASPETAMVDEVVVDSSEFNFDVLHSGGDAGRETPRTKDVSALSAVADERSMVDDAPFDLDQILSKVNLKDNGTKELDIQLTPEHLGNLKMRVIQEGNDLSIEMVAATAEAKALLDQNLPELRAQFLDQEEGNFDQLEFAVDVEQHKDPDTGQPQDHGGHQADNVAKQQQEEIETQTTVSQQYQKSGLNSGVNIYV